MSRSFRREWIIIEKEAKVKELYIERLARVIAPAYNGGDWEKDYTEEQKKVHVDRIVAALSQATPSEVMLLAGTHVRVLANVVTDGELYGHHLTVSDAEKVFTQMMAAAFLEGIV